MEIKKKFEILSLIIFWVTVFSTNNVLAFQSRAIIEGITIDSLFIQGKSYRLKFALKPNELNLIKEGKESFYGCITFYKKTDSRILNYVIHKLKPINKNSNILQMEFTIPKQTSYFNIFLYNRKHLLLEHSFPRLIVFNEEMIMEEGASEILIQSDTTKINYRRVFEWERKTWPTNYLIYAAKWLYELQNKLLTNEIIKSDLDEIEKGYSSDDPNSFVLKFIAYSLLKDTNNSKTFLTKITKKDNIFALNNESVVELFWELLINSNFDKQYLSSLISSIMFLNPFSLFTERRIIDGTIARINQDTAFEILCLRLKNNPNLISEKINLIPILVYRKDSLELAIKIGEELRKLLYDSNYYEKGYDPFNRLQTQSRMIWTGLATAYIVANEYKKAVQILNEARLYYGIFDIMQETATEMIGNCYEKTGLIDSAIYFYALSLKYNRFYPLPLRNLRKIYKKLNKVYVETEFEKWVDSLVQNIQWKKVKLDCTAPSLLVDGKKIILSDSSINIVVLQFFNTYCKPCKKILDSIKSYLQSKNQRKDVRFFAISNENISLVKNFIENYSSQIEVVENANEIFKYFNITFVPVTIIINKFGEIENVINSGSEEIDFSILLNNIN